MTKQLAPLEALKELKDEVVANYYQDQNWFDERYKIIETALKALEIIKKKGICMFLLEDTKSAEEYNEYIDNFSGCDEYFNEDEFDLLKEVLK